MKNRPRTRRLSALLVGVLAAATLAGCSTSSNASSTTTAEKNPYNLITPGTLRVGSIGDGKPYDYTDASGNWQGFDVDILKAAAKHAGIKKFEWVGQDFSSLLSSVASGKYDVGAACIGVTAERKKTIAYTDSYNNGYLVVLSKKGAGITDKGDLKGKRIGVIQGTVQETYAKDHFTGVNVVQFPDNNSAAQGLRNGTVDTAFFDTDTAGSFVKQYPDQLQQAFKVVSDAPCAFVLKQGNTKLQKALNAGIRAQIADGTVAKLTKKWLPDSPILPEYQPKS